jgi:uncharacterized protein (TIGR03663 family)
MMTDKDPRTDSASSPADSSQFGPPWLTVESAFYISLVLAAAVLRFHALGSQPLQQQEAKLGLDVWRFYTGGAASIRGHSPLLFHGTTLLCALLGASDYVVRVIPALAGTAMVGLCYLLRPHLGRHAALICAAILAFSPSFVFFSRQLDGGILAAAAGLALLAGLLGYLGQRRESQLYQVAAALGFLLLTDGAAYATLLALAAFFAVSMLYSRWKGEAGPGSLVGWFDEEGPRGKPWPAMGVFAGLVLLLSTGLLVNPHGVQATLDLFSSWVGQFASTTAGQPWHYYVSLLVAYELPVLLFGLVGAYSLARRDLLSMLLTVWFGISLVLYSLMGVKPPSGVLQILLPLTLLAARTIADLLDQIRKGEQWLWARLSLAVCLPAIFHLFLQLAAFGDPADPGDPRHLLLALLSLVFLVCVVLVVGVLSMDWRDSLRSGGVVVLAILAGLMVHTTWRLNYHRPGNPFEIAVQNPTSPDVRNLAQAVEEFSNQQQRQRYSVEITVVEDESPVLAWYLRDFANLAFVSELTSPATPVVITSLTDPPYLPDYRGARFRIQSSWAGQDQPGHELVDWFLFRESIQAPVHRDVVMWVAPEAEE